jgi:drug/metabolite transporter (DMT)-like permease
MWIILSLIAGLADALRDAFSKQSSKTIPRSLITWSYSLFALPFFVPLALSHLPETIPLDFWLLVTCAALLHVGGGLMLVKALHVSDLSVCTPMVAFTPVFLLVVGPLLTGDIPSTGGTIGALLVVAGSYMLNISKKSRGLLAPLKALYTDTGPRLMLALALLWSVTGSIDRIAVQRFELLFWASVQLCAIAVFLIPVVIKSGALTKNKSSLKAANPPNVFRALFTLGAINCASFATYLIALQIAPVHYVVCVKRSSIPFSILLGKMMFQEQALRERLPGGVLMLAGVVIISLWG